MYLPKAKTTVNRTLFICLFILCRVTFAQNNNKSIDTTQSLTLDQCINYAMDHQPVLNQTIIGQAIAKTTNAINLSGWLPQVTLSGSLIHYIQQPTTCLL